MSVLPVPLFIMSDKTEAESAEACGNECWRLCNLNKAGKTVIKHNIEQISRNLF